MKISYQAILLSLVAFGLGACSEENPWGFERGKGGIDLKLTASADVKDAIPMVRAGAPALEAPDVADFAISLHNLDTDEVKTWPTLAEFEAESGFESGSYTLTAFYGSENETGFDKPYFTGSATFNVLSERTAEVELTAQLANSMVSVDYTDAFKDFFSDYKVSVHTAGQEYVEFAKTETRPAFVAPGDVQLQLTMTKKNNGKTTTIAPAEFPAAARHHYHVTFDVKASETGDAALTVSFDDSLTQEDVFIQLSDELFDAKAPELTAVGFVDKQTLEALEKSPFGEPVKFKANCQGGIKSAKLTVIGDYTPVFGKEVELVGASADTQQKLAEAGINVAGLFKNPANMALIDITDFPKSLPTNGLYGVSVAFTDLQNRVSEPLAVNISTKPLVLNFNSGSAIYNGQATLEVGYNGAAPEKNISFKSKDRNGRFVDAEVVSVKESTRTRAFETKNYIVTLNVADTEFNPLPMQMFLSGSKHGDDFTIDVVEPQFSLEADAFATYAMFKVMPEDASQLAAVTNGVKLYLNGDSRPLPSDGIHRDIEKGLISIYGLTPSTEYNLAWCLTDKGNGSLPASKLTFTTEATAQIPNGDFSQTENTINMTGVQVGGEYTGIAFSSPKYHYSSSIVRDMPKGWTSINAKTCWNGAKNINTWFCVPSTYADNGAVVVRSVGYSHNGSTPALDKKTARYYNPSAPSFSDTEKVAGELFLGEYSFDGNEHRIDGIEFVSRPRSMTFEYKYEPNNGEKAHVEISVVSAEGVVLSTASSDLDKASDFTEKTISLSGYNNFGVKAQAVRIRFLSSTAAVPSIIIPTGDALNEYKLNGIGNGLKNNTLSANSYHAVATGSVLTIDNVKLNY